MCDVFNFDGQALNKRDNINQLLELSRCIFCLLFTKQKYFFFSIVIFPSPFPYLHFTYIRVPPLFLLYSFITLPPLILLKKHQLGIRDWIFEYQTITWFETLPPHACNFSRIWLAKSRIFMVAPLLDRVDMWGNVTRAGNVFPFPPALVEKRATKEKKSQKQWV